jgi:hypothetical protein
VALQANPPGAVFWCAALSDGWDNEATAVAAKRLEYGKGVLANAQATNDTELAQYAIRFIAEYEQLIADMLREAEK